MMKTLFTPLLLAVVFASASRAADPFELKPNDRVVFIGDALVERDTAYNYLETMLTVRYHGKGVTFRNIGWSGDTVWGESRAVFGQQKDGYNALIKAINETRPTVVFLNYGMNESFAGAAGLAHFEEGYNALLDNVLDPAKDAQYVAAPPAQAKDRRNPKEELAPAAAEKRPVPRVVLVSPIAFQTDEANALSKNVKQNENLKLYSEAIKKLAEKRGALFIDMFSHFGGGTLHKRARLTSDGMHLNAEGYKFYAAGVETALGLKPAAWKFKSVDAGEYEPVNKPAEEAKQQPPIEKLRELIEAKNLQFFNKWRPQNETYIFLFRKREQGKNAKEIPEFDPFITSKEAEIGRLADDVVKGLGL